MEQKFKAALYKRVSTAYQVDKDSLPMQEKDLINYCTLVLGIEDYEVFTDAGYSAKNTYRPAYQEMMNRVRNREFSHIIVWKLDRISRNIADFAIMWDELEKLDVKFVSKNDNFQTDTPMGKAMLNIIMTFAQLEREMTSVRVTATMISRAQDGKWNGANVPLGYKFDYDIKYPVPDEKEAELIHFIYDTYEQSKSSTQLTRYLNEHNITTKRKGKWSTKTVSDIIRNPFYKGTLRYNYRKSARGKIKPENEWVIVEDNHEPIITKEQWERVNKIMDNNNKEKNRGGRKHSQKHVHVFGGIVKCGNCLGFLHGNQDRPRPNMNNWTPSTYRCGNYTRRVKCTQGNNSSDIPLGNFMINFISNLLYVQNNPKSYLTIETLEVRLLKGKTFDKVNMIITGLNDLLNLLNQKLEPVYIKTDKKDVRKINDNNQRTILENKIDRLSKAIEKWDDIFLFGDGQISQRDYLAKKKKMEDEIKQLQTEINQLRDETVEEQNEIFKNSKLSKYVLEFKLQSGEEITYQKLASSVSVDDMKDFMQMLLTQIVVDKGNITLVEFKNGLTFEFSYK